jgi:hypothetical protein
MAASSCLQQLLPCRGLALYLSGTSEIDRELFPFCIILINIYHENKMEVEVTRR